MSFLKNLFRRKSGDPLAEAFFDTFHIHLLALPRENVSIGDIYRRNDDGSQKVALIGNITSLVTPTFEIPPSKPGQMADVQKILSKEIDANIGISFLETFLAALTGGNTKTGATIGAHFKKQNTKKVQFNFSNLEHEYVEPLVIGKKLGNGNNNKYQIEDNATYDPNQKYYLVTGLVKSPSISIVPTAEDNTTLGGEAKINDIASVDGNLSINQSNSGKITFANTAGKKLIIGVDLFELQYDPTYKTFRLEPVEKVQAVYGKDLGKIKKVYEHAVIGDEGESVFIELDNEVKK